MKSLITHLVLPLVLLLTISVIAAQPAVNLTAPEDDAILVSPDVSFAWEGLPGTAQQYTLKVIGVGFEFTYTKAMYPNAAGCKTTAACVYTPVDLKLNNNKKYRWFIIAKISGSGEIKSIRYDFTTAFPKPAQPMLLMPGQGVTVDGDQPEFQWQAGTDTTQLQLRVFDSQNVLIFGHNLPVDQCSGATCSLAMAEFGGKLPQKGSYTWWVRAKNPFGQTKSLVNTFTYTPSAAYQMLALVNKKRCNAGLAPLALNPQLNAAAQRHSEDMAAHDFVSHQGSDGSSFQQRIMEAGYSGTPKGETIAGHATFSTATAIFNVWWQLPESKGYMMNASVREIGVAHVYNAATDAENLWTVVFGAKGTTVLGVCV